MLNLAVALLALVPVQALAQVVALVPAPEMRLINVKAEQVVYKSRPALRVTDTAPPKTEDWKRLVILPQTAMEAGSIEVDLCGELAPGAAESARGFVGLAFRVRPDGTKFESIYLRPTNGRAEDQVRRNHSVQYISAPDFPWEKLRKEFPEKYETYVDLVPGEWTKVRIEFEGTRARLYVHGAQQPTLIVNDLKLGEGGGAIGLWVGPGTVAHFSGMRITRQPASQKPPAVTAH